MKKLIFLFGLILVCFISYSQESTTEDKFINYDETWFTYTGTSNATTATDSVWYFTVRKESLKKVFYEIKIDLDSISGTKQIVPVVLQGKILLSDNFTPLDTINWVNGSDTTIRFIQYTTAQKYRYYRPYLRSALKGFIFKVSELSGVFKEE